MQDIGKGTYSTRSGAKGGSHENPAIAKNPTSEGGSAGGPSGNVGAGNSGSGAEKSSGGNSGADQGGGGQAEGDENGAGNSAVTSGAFVNPAGSGTGIYPSLQLILL